MICNGRIAFAVASAVFTAACGLSAPTAPSSVGTVAPTVLALDDDTASSELSGWSTNAASCAVDVGTTTHPLPAFHVYVNWLNASIDASNLQCGQVNSLDRKMELLAKALDANPPAFETACGVSTAVAREIDALMHAGQLAELTFPPPVPGGPTTLEQIAEELNATWCAAARGDLTGPRS